MSLMQRGFTRLMHEGKQIDLASPDDYKLDDFENVYVLVDRLTARADIRQRLVDSLETCFREGHGQAVIALADGAHAVNPLSASGERAGGEVKRRVATPPPPLPASGEGLTTPSLLGRFRMQVRRHRVSRLLSRVCSASTIRLARVPRARASATRLVSISIWLFQIRD